jgi:hypothetical protein
MTKWGSPEESHQAAERINMLSVKLFGNNLYHQFILPASLNFVRGAVVKWLGK